MCAGHRLNDCEAQPGAPFGTRLVRAAEALERVRQEVRREALAFVADAEDELSVFGLSTEPDRSGAMAERVVHEIPERLLEADPGPH